LVNRRFIIISSKKQKKRKAIAQSCSVLFQENQYYNISISKLASTAGIGKGTIYEYFENKEDIVFELMTCLQETYDEKLESLLYGNYTIIEKINFLFMLFINDDEIITKQRDIYKQFLVICLSTGSDKMKEYNSNIRNKYINILDTIISDKIIATNMYDSIIAMFINSNTLMNYNLKKNIQEYIIKQINTINQKGKIKC
jgi:AcrR family transcriptional regulator